MQPPKYYMVLSLALSYKYTHSAVKAKVIIPLCSCKQRVIDLVGYIFYNRAYPEFQENSLDAVTLILSLL